MKHFANNNKIINIAEYGRSVMTFTLYLTIRNDKEMGQRNVALYWND